MQCGANAGAVAKAIQLFPENLRTSENITALATSGANAQAVVIAIQLFPENLRTSENITALATSGANAEVIAKAIWMLPQNCRTSETVAVLAESGVNARVVVDAILQLPKELRTQENFNAFVEKIIAAHQRFDRSFGSFPPDQIWRLYIDWIYQKQDVSKNLAGLFDVDHGYAGEPGYSKAMKETFGYIRDTIGEKMDAKWICDLHDRCVNGVRTIVRRLGTGYITEPLMKGFAYKSSGDWSYSLAHRKLTAPVLQEAEQFRLFQFVVSQADIDSENYLAGYYQHIEKIVSYGSFHGDRVAAFMNKRIISYYERIQAREATDEDKLSAIADLLRALEIYHVFPDANQRTYAFALLTKLLIENGFSPAILEDPCMFDGYCTTKSMVQQIQQGMERFIKFGKAAHSEAFH